MMKPIRYEIEKKIEFLFKTEYNSHKLKEFIFGVFDAMEEEITRLEGHLEEIGEMTSGNKPPTEKEKSTEERISDLERAVLELSNTLLSEAKRTISMANDGCLADKSDHRVKELEDAILYLTAPWNKSKTTFIYGGDAVIEFDGKTIVIEGAKNGR